jgi:hypothetical protein
MNKNMRIFLIPFFYLIFVVMSNIPPLHFLPPLSLPEHYQYFSAVPNPSPVNPVPFGWYEQQQQQQQQQQQWMYNQQWINHCNHQIPYVFLNQRPADSLQLAPFLYPSVSPPILPHAVPYQEPITTPTIIQPPQQQQQQLSPTQLVLCAAAYIENNQHQQQQQPLTNLSTAKWIEDRLAKREAEHPTSDRMGAPLCDAEHRNRSYALVLREAEHPTSDRMGASLCDAEHHNSMRQSRRRPHDDDEEYIVNNDEHRISDRMGASLCDAEEQERKLPIKKRKVATTNNSEDDKLSNRLIWTEEMHERFVYLYNRCQHER